MPITSNTAKDLVRLGANIEITTDANYTSVTVKEIVRIASSKESHVLVHAGNYTSDTLKDIAIIGRKSVTIKI